MPPARAILGAGSGVWADFSTYVDITKTLRVQRNCVGVMCFPCYVPYRMRAFLSLERIDSRRWGYGISPFSVFILFFV